MTKDIRHCTATLARACQNNQRISLPAIFSSNGTIMPNLSLHSKTNTTPILQVLSWCLPQLPWPHNWWLWIGLPCWPWSLIHLWQAQLPPGTPRILHWNLPWRWTTCLPREEDTRLANLMAGHIPKRCWQPALSTRYSVYYGNLHSRQNIKDHCQRRLPQSPA